MKDRIRKIRRDLDLTQQEFADRLGIKRGTIANYELGRNEPVDSVVSLICREFGISEEWLRDGIGDMYAPDPGNELEALVKKYDLTAADQILIEKYLGLKPDIRDAVLKFMTDVVASIQESEKDFSDVPSTPEQFEHDFQILEGDDKKGGLG